MALSAICDAAAQLIVTDDTVTTSFDFDSIVDIIVNNNGLLIASTIAITKSLPIGEVKTHTFTGTGAECIGIATAARDCIRDRNLGLGYTPWSYP